MIYIDDRTGSKEFYPLLRTTPAELRSMEFADFAFIGNGPDGVPWQIGIERKTLTDLVNSMNSGRLAGHQVPGLLSTYNTVYLLVEGLSDYDLSKNTIRCHRSRGNYADYSVVGILNFLNTMSVIQGIHVWHSGSMAESSQWIKCTYRWWTGKEFDQHRSHLQQHQSGVFNTKHSLLRCWAAELPGVGWKRSGVIEQHFPSAEALVGASINDLCEIDGIGKVLARKIYEEIRKEIRQ